MITRRTVSRAAWSVPLVVACAPVPAFAASMPLTCGPTARCKRPGDPEDKSYVVDTNCTSSNGAIVAVEVRDKYEAWTPATQDETGAWVAPGFGDSRRDRLVRITDSQGVQQTYMVSFPPC